MRLAGRYVTFVWRETNPKSFDGVDSISEFDVHSGRRVIDATRDPSLYTIEDLGSTVNGRYVFGGITELAINNKGDVAWIVAFAKSSAIYQHSLHVHTRRLDAAGGYAISGLAMTAKTVSWTDQGLRRTATI